MSRSENWNTKNEITKIFNLTDDPSAGAGPILYCENGKKYSDDSEAHIGVFGKTGKGKSQCASLHFSKEIALKGESQIVLDPKGECYIRTSGFYPKERIFCINLREPYKSPTKFNLLKYPYTMCKSSNPNDNDIGSSMISETCKGLYPDGLQVDKFWNNSAANYLKGLIYGLFEIASNEKQINFDSIAVMMEQSETKRHGTFLLKEFYDMLPAGSLAKRNLATYVTGPNETRASIHSVASSGFEVLCRSRGVMQLLAQDTFNLLELDATKPFALFIITPDETDVYDSLAGLIISQITQHLIRVAQDMGGKLPVRVNLILEELGSVGKSIPNLPNLMVAGRSRNIRLMLVLQGYSQLEDIYGKSKAETIASCIGITIGFSTNNWETLTEWSNRCGERQYEINENIVKEPLITAAQLAAMPTGTALILVDGQYKFISHLPFYDRLYREHSSKKRKSYKKYTIYKPKTIDLEAIVDDYNQKGIRNKFNSQEIHAELPFEEPMISIPSTISEEDIDRMINEIDSQIAIMNKNEQKQKKKLKKNAKYTVIIIDLNGNKSKIACLVSSVCEIEAEPVNNLLENLPCEINFFTKKEATKFLNDVTNAGGLAVLKTL